MFFCHDCCTIQIQHLHRRVHWTKPYALPEHQAHPDTDVLSHPDAWGWNSDFARVRLHWQARDHQWRLENRRHNPRFLPSRYTVTGKSVSKKKENDKGLLMIDIFVQSALPLIEWFGKTWILPDIIKILVWMLVCVAFRSVSSTSILKTPCSTLRLYTTAL